MSRLAPILIGTGIATTIAGILVAAANRRRQGTMSGAGLGRGSDAGTVRVHKGAMPIKRRLYYIQRNVMLGTRDASMRKLTSEVTKNCAARDSDCEARAIFDYITEPTADRPQGRVRYTGDVGEVVMDPELGRPNKKPEAADLYQSPMRTLEYGAGDCDDMSALGASMLALAGIDAELDVSSNECKTHDHIYAVARLPKMGPGARARRVPVDTTLGRGQFGRWPRFCSKVTFPS